MVIDVRYAVLYVSLLMLLLGGCQGLNTPSPQPPSPLIATTAPIWRHLQLRRRTYHTLKGLAELRLKAPKGGGTLDNTVFVLDRFSKVRLEGIGPFGQPLFLYTFVEPQFALYLPQQQRVYTGGSTPEPFDRLIGLAIEPGLLPYVLMGDMPLTRWPAPGRLMYLASEDLYYWEGAAPPSPWHYRVWLDPYRLLPVRLELAAPAAQTRLKVTYDDFQELGGLTLPYRITMTQPQTRQRVVWQYRDVEFNTEVAASLFEMRVPPGTEHVELKEERL
ncbi:DUF4292 domain-containing protein [Candidatus Entotheonella palauensis]|uniref:DUF4292 domain-containing protein n=1 Tax=Candidatus Entotheonella gemina TaxID=1429439 RepID=W4LXD1_9BACT|nr:DUF4292 domain-containing protein [Candidatus Entotheonella palauensis]ETX02575.1 MAG: hypothetical protein ETSY2_35260 [Candidatus Entotheonella gemina]